MTTSTDLANQLAAIVTDDSDEFTYRQYNLVEQWERDGVGPEAVQPILTCMESNPSIDFGTPGPLVHFAEQFYGRDYISLVVDSFCRRPTSHTAWLMNRIFNDESSHAVRRKYTELFEAAMRRPDLDRVTKMALKSFLEHQRGETRV